MTLCLWRPRSCISRGDGANVLLRVFLGGDHARMGAGGLVLRVVVIAGVGAF